jgi:hypothetical protein
MKLRTPDRTFNGYYGPIEFKDGVSVRIVSPREANQLRAVMSGIEIVQDDGVTLDEALNAISTLMPRGYYNEFHNPIPSPYLTDWLGQYPEGEDPNVSKVEDGSEVVVQEPQGPQPVKEPRFSRAELEKIADEGGIAKLRDIGNEVGVKANSIEKLIEAILARA